MIRKKTASEIVGDIIALIRDSELAASVSGEIYREGSRPRDSKAEDISVIFTTGEMGQMQDGVVTINVFVPQIAPFDDGVFVPDSARLEEIEAFGQRMVDSWTADRSDYRFTQNGTIRSQHNDERRESFVVIRLAYRYYSIQ